MKFALKSVCTLSFLVMTAFGVNYALTGKCFCQAKIAGCKCSNCGCADCVSAGKDCNCQNCPSTCTVTAAHTCPKCK